MSSIGRDALPDLVAALEAALRSWDTQSEGLQDLRNRAVETDQRFADLLRARAAGDQAPAEWKPAFSMDETLEMGARSAQLTRAWREGLLDAWQALMRGFAEPELRPGLEQVSGILRRLELLQLEPSPPAAAPALPAYSPLEPAEDPDERRRQKYALAQSMMASMREQFADTDRQLQETARESGMLLRQAVELARSLLS